MLCWHYANLLSSQKGQWELNPECNLCQAGLMCTQKEWSMDVKERRPYCSLTKSRREKERRYTNSSADNEECRVPTQKSYSSSETLKAFDHDSSRLLYGNRVKDLVHREADEYTRQGRSWLSKNTELTGWQLVGVVFSSLLEVTWWFSKFDAYHSDSDFCYRRCSHHIPE